MKQIMLAGSRDDAWGKWDESKSHFPFPHIPIVNSDSAVVKFSRLLSCLTQSPNTPSEFDSTRRREITFFFLKFNDWEQVENRIIFCSLRHWWSSFVEKRNFCLHVNFLLFWTICADFSCNRFTCSNEQFQVAIDFSSGFWRVKSLYKSDSFCSSVFLVCKEFCIYTDSELAKSFFPWKIFQCCKSITIISSN